MKKGYTDYFQLWGKHKRHERPGRFGISNVKTRRAEAKTEIPGPALKEKKARGIPKGREEELRGNFTCIPTYSQRISEGGGRKVNMKKGNLNCCEVIGVSLKIIARKGRNATRPVRSNCRRKRSLFNVSKVTLRNGLKGGE